MRIYVASSWRNQHQPAIVAGLRQRGHEVYDFRNPPGRTGFAWSAIDPDWESWDAEAYREALRHPLAQAGFKSDMDALRAADAVILVLPCGRSAHLELGWAAGAGKRTAILTREGEEPELMALMADHITDDMWSIHAWLGGEPMWRDRQGDLWWVRPDGLMETAETGSFPVDHVWRKWGPLTPAPRGDQR